MITENLRPYQREAFEAAVSWMTKSIEPACMELATGAGKSWIIAAVAEWVWAAQQKRVLCLQPSVDLTHQNHEKYLATGERASIFSASAGSKCMRYPVVYATPGSVVRSMSRFGDDFGCVIVDECHSTTPTIIAIIEAIRARNPRVRVLGLSATPYTMSGGYIYQYDVDGRFMDESQARDPYYNTLLYRVQTRELLDMGYLTPVVADPAVMHYEAAGLQLDRKGNFNAAEVDRVFVGRNRLTSQIVADVVQHSRYRRGVMLFAASVAHAKEIMESLPPELSRMIGGGVNMGKTDRADLVADFKAQRFKYIVSVGTLTTGFDAPHVDVVAVLRATESPGLFQQIIGRGLRLYEGKENCLLLDYAQNIDRHSLHDDLFTPEIKTSKAKEKGEPIPAKCPDCDYENLFSARPNEEGFGIDDNGYFLDAAQERVCGEHGPIPAHFGRRCTGQIRTVTGEYERCNYRWTAKPCPECEHENDIAARFCEKCKAEIVDPNEKLQAEYAKVKADPYQTHTDEVLEWWPREHLAQSGKATLRVTYKTPYREFEVFYHPESKSQFVYGKWESLCNAVYRGHIAPDAATFMKYLDKGERPRTITYRKDKETKFFNVIAHNRLADVPPSTQQAQQQQTAMEAA